MPEIRFVKIRDINTHPEPHVTVIEFADYLTVSEDTVYRLVEKGALEGVRVGRSLRIKTESARMFYKSNETGHDF